MAENDNFFIISRGINLDEDHTLLQFIAPGFNLIKSIQYENKDLTDEAIDQELKKFQVESSGHIIDWQNALKSKDKDMLERCFALTDGNSIRATVQRQSSREAAELLEEVALRIHKRPGRTGNLMVWVQWALVCHGGYIAHQPELMG